MDFDFKALHVPAVALDRHGDVIAVTHYAEANFDDEIKVKDGRLFINAPDFQAALERAINRIINIRNSFFQTIAPIYRAPQK